MGEKETSKIKRERERRREEERERRRGRRREECNEERHELVCLSLTRPAQHVECRSQHTPHSLLSPRYLYTRGSECVCVGECMYVCVCVCVCV